MDVLAASHQLRLPCIIRQSLGSMQLAICDDDEDSYPTRVVVE